MVDHLKASCVADSLRTMIVAVELDIRTSLKEDIAKSSAEYRY
jgi:hypothetical protein